MHLAHWRRKMPPTTSSKESSSERLTPEEIERLEALRRYDVLDTPREEQFDRVVRLAARWFEVPISLVTFLSKERQWFKACVGLDRRETSREVSFCEHNIYDEEVLVVENAIEDPRFDENPLVTGPPGIRFYAGAPLIAPGGHVVGSLCVIDTEPRDAEPMDFEPLKDLAAIVIDELELRLANERVRELNRALAKAEEAERRRLSHLLQEDLQQLIGATRMIVENICGEDSLTDQQSKRLGRAISTLNEADEVTRSLSSRFAPPVENQSFLDTLHWLAGKLKEHHGLSVSILSRGEVDINDESLKTALYRAVRELLFNVIEHAGTGEAQIYLIGTQERLRVVVEDDGRGISERNRPEDRFGLQSIRERIGTLGGNVTVEPGAGASTRALIQVECHR